MSNSGMVKEGSGMYIHIMEYSTVKKSKLLLQVIAWLNLTVLSERSMTLENTYQKSKNILYDSKFMVREVRIIITFIGLGR